MFFVYFAKSLKNNKIYVGRTDKEPDIRIKEHNQSSNKWTKQNGPFKLQYYESFLCKEDAINKEGFYKTGIGKKIKRAICEVMNPEL
jgi:putative endonuclease